MINIYDEVLWILHRLLLSHIVNPDPCSLPLHVGETHPEAALPPYCSRAHVLKVVIYDLLCKQTVDTLKEPNCRIEMRMYDQRDIKHFYISENKLQSCQSDIRTIGLSEHLFILYGDNSE